MPGTRQPTDVILAKGRKHLSKAEEAERRAGEVRVEKAKTAKPPKWLPEGLRAEFRALGKALIAAGIYTDLDADTLGRYLVAQRQYVQASRKVDEAMGIWMREDAAARGTGKAVGRGASKTAGREDDETAGTQTREDAAARGTGKAAGRGTGKAAGRGADRNTGDRMQKSADPGEIDEEQAARMQEEADRWGRIQERCFKQARNCANDMGLTVTSRCRLVVPDRGRETEQTNPFLRLIEGGEARYG